MVRCPLSLDKSDAAFPGQLNHGVIRQFRNLHLQHSHLFPCLFNGRTSVAAGAFLSVRDRQFCEGLKIRILRQFAIANRVVPGITRFFQA